MTKWEAVAVIVSSWAATIAILENWWRRRRDKRNDAHAAAQAAAARMVARVDRLEVEQFGNNHDGLRQKVNDLDAKVDRRVDDLDAKVDRRVNGLDAKLDGVIESLAELRGEVRAVPKRVRDGRST